MEHSSLKITQLLPTNRQRQTVIKDTFYSPFECVRAVPALSVRQENVTIHLAGRHYQEKMPMVKCSFMFLKAPGDVENHQS